MGNDPLTTGVHIRHKNKHEKELVLSVMLVVALMLMSLCCTCEPVAMFEPISNAKGAHNAFGDKSHAQAANPRYIVEARPE